MRDRAYFSGRAILRINLRARVLSQEHASKHLIPVVSSSSFKDTDSDLYHVIYTLKQNLDDPQLTLNFGGMEGTTSAHWLWVSNLFVDLSHVGPKPIMETCGYLLDAARTNHQATDANILLMWYMFLGGRVEEESVWAVNKSYAVVSLSFIPTCLIFRIPAIYWNPFYLTCPHK